MIFDNLDSLADDGLDMKEETWRTREGDLSLDRQSPFHDREPSPEYCVLLSIALGRSLVKFAMRRWSGMVW